MPTEEVFTAPDFRRAEGYVTSTKPLSYNGNIIEGIKVTFENGEIVDITAEKGDQVMKDLVFKTRERVPWVNVPSYQTQAQFPNQALPSSIRSSMKMPLTTWPSGSLCNQCRRWRRVHRRRTRSSRPQPLRRSRRLHDRFKPNEYRRHPRRRHPRPSLPQRRLRQYREQDRNR